MGPTATGKTALAVALAQRFDGELLNADSRQTIRGLRIGTARPSAEELQGVACHLLDLHDPDEAFSVADWLGAARLCVDEVRERGHLPIVVGGTGLYVRALLSGFDLAATRPDAPSRQRWEQILQRDGGLEELAAALRSLDADAAARVDLRNPRRVVRALEVAQTRSRAGAQPAPAIRLGIDVERAEHRRRVETRVQTIFDADGIIDETRDALARGVSRAALLRSGIGYREALDVIDETLDVAAAVASTVQRTLRYAKSQRTWMRSEPGVIPIDNSAATLTPALDQAIARLQDAAARPPW